MNKPVVKKRISPKVDINEFSATVVKGSEANTDDMNDNVNTEARINSLINQDNRLMDHSPEPNCSLIKNNHGEVHFTASRDITAGEKLILDCTTDESAASCLTDSG